MTIAWVLGSRGLLGSALCRALHREETELFSPASRFSWTRQTELVPQLETAVRNFAVRAYNSGRWEIYWAAGLGTMGTSKEELEPETENFSALLHLLAADTRLRHVPGAFAFSSSAGAIYAGSQDYVITEDTAPEPTTAYARAKLAQEDMLRAFTQGNDGVPALLARFSTIYGPGQSLGKPQGLLTHIARCVLKNIPVRIYVPFDTIRDYIASDDAADTMIAGLRGVARAPRVQIKIIASEQPVTIAEIIATFKRVTRRAPHVITSTSRLSAIYPHRLRFQSRAVPVTPSLPRTSLPIGIARIVHAEREAFLRGSRTEVR